MAQKSVIKSPPRNHLLGLQSLRGVASVIVLVQHCSFYFATTKIFRFLSELVFNSHAAVVLFFVLSGFVLVRSLEKESVTIDTLFIFYVRRAFRIYPALWFAVFITILVSFFVSHVDVEVPQTSAWFKAVFTPNPGSLEFAKALAGIGMVALPPLWTIRVEIIASLLLPLLAWITTKGRVPIAIFTILFLAITPAIALSNHHSLNFLVDFSIGAALVPWASVFSHVKARFARLVAGVSIVCLLLFRIINPEWRFEAGYNGVTPDLIEGLSAGALILVASVKPSSVQFLQSKFLIHIGDISYSVYLLHFPIMVLIAKTLALAIPAFLNLHQNFSAALLTALTLLVTIPLSELSYRFIEAKCMRFSKHILRGFMP